jgi:transcriptional regulator GlxA family with amidase domain
LARGAVPEEQKDGSEQAQTIIQAMPRTANTDAGNGLKIARCIAFMSRHLDERMTMVQLAERVGLSPSYFWALFKQKTGHSPVQFLIRLRMHQACHLLDCTSMNIKSIAAVLGYKNSFHFSRQFKSLHGLAPANYQRPDPSTMRLCLDPLSLLPGRRCRSTNEVPERAKENTVPGPPPPAGRPGPGRPTG